MTKKDIEEGLKKEMYQNIPDKNALWQNIESRLPDQPASQQMHRKITITSGRRFLTVAACFLIVITGMQYIRHQRPDVHNTADSAPVEDIAPDDAVQSVRFDTNVEYFQEDAILSRTEFFIDVRVLECIPEDNGVMRYLLQILDVYGGELDSEEITCRTDSAYILEQNHEYVIPVYDQENHEFALSYTCAPQIERTQDHKLIIPNGWYTLMQSDAVPVQYARSGVDDYFYDRMYLTPDWNLELLIQKFENL